jgi:hypothetical protein
MLQQVPDEFLDRELKVARINHASMWYANRPHVSCALDPLDEDRTFAVDVYNAQRSSWDRKKRTAKNRSTLAGRIVESFYLSNVHGVLWPSVHRTLGPADCRKAIVVCGDIDESKYVEVTFVEED